MRKRNANLNCKGKWGIGAVHRDSQGEVLAAATWLVMGYDDSEVAEAFAWYRSVKLAINRSFQKVVFESVQDSKGRQTGS